MNSKILVFAHEFPPNVGGAGVVAYQNAKALTALGLEVYVLTKEYKDNINADGINFIPVQKKRLWPFSYVNSCNFNEFDLIILNDPQSIFFAGVFFGSAILKKCVCYLHGSEPELILERTTFKKKLSGFRYFFMRALINSLDIVFVSFFMKEKFLRSFKFNFKNRYKDLIDNKSLPIFYAGVDAGCFCEPVMPNTLVELKRVNAKIYFSCGRIIEEKGYREIAITLSKLPSDFCFVWYVAGVGPFELQLKRLVKQLNIDSKVCFLGRLDRRELSNYFAYCDCFILLPQLKESFSLVHLEAQFFGIPAIGLNHSGMRESIKHKVSGYLLDDTDELEQLLYSEKYKELSTDEIIFFAKSFSTNNQMKMFVKHFSIINTG